MKSGYVFTTKVITIANSSFDTLPPELPIISHSVHFAAVLKIRQVLLDCAIPISYSPVSRPSSSFRFRSPSTKYAQPVKGRCS